MRYMRRRFKKYNFLTACVFRCARERFGIVMAQFNENLTNKRALKGLSQKAMAEAIGVAQSTYSLYEKGAREPNIDKIIKISAVLGVTSDELLGIEQKEDENYAMFSRLNAVDRAEIMGTIKHMLKGYR